MLWYALSYKLQELAEVLAEKFFPLGGELSVCVCNLKRLNIACTEIITDQLLLTYADFLFYKAYELSFWEKIFQE